MLVTLVMVELIPISVFSQDAPITRAGISINPGIGSEVSIPVTVTGFSGIGSFTLRLVYDTAVVSVSSATPCTELPGCTVDWTTQPGTIVIAWSGTFPKTLPDNSHLADIAFSPHATGSAILQWNDDGTSCEFKSYSSTGTYQVLNDTPQSTYYLNGLITTHGAPVTLAPVITDATYGPLTIDIRANGIQNIGAISLTLRYDPLVLVFLDNFVPNTLLASNGSFMVSTYPAADGNLNLAISWIVNPDPDLPPITLPDSSIIASFFFYYADEYGTSTLAWIDDGSSCEYASSDLDALWDAPTQAFYKDGVVTFRKEAPHTSFPDLSVGGSTVCVPVNVTGFTDVAGFDLTFDYDTAVMTFQSVETGALPLTWVVTGSEVSPGRVALTGTGPSFSLPGDSGTILSACFQYHGGSSLLSWHTESGGCQYMDALNGYPFYDLPAHDFYRNGFIRAGLEAGFAADDTTPVRNQPVTFTDQTEGTPLTWQWSFIPEEPVVFLSGTSSASQNPEVMFSEGGYYTVSLVVANTDGSSSTSHPNYIHAGLAGLWTGMESTLWTQPGNWDNKTIPDATVDVIIPGVCPNWPEYNGDLVIGVQCKSVTLQNTGSKLTVTGNLIIN